MRKYEFVLGNFHNHLGDIELSIVTSENILTFMSTITDGTKQNTKKLRFTLLSAFFNFVKNSHEPNIKNPCDSPALRKFFRAGKPAQLKILEKDVVDEIIFRTRNQRNRLMLELMARSGMRVGEASGKDYQLQAAKEASAFRRIALLIEKPQTGIHDTGVILGSTVHAYFIEGLL